ncbi:hypothetical protein Acr_03g0011900 [Actinidia rufa]|uniref:DUF7651 domain-containing protein n=1 Tax=Actinidia rufa TaxID=165716 RepID=A0A7J0EE05_9ERIC|nr:hypothetical protein Acr_03g0011900 [Actinidia rufa]
MTISLSGTPNDGLLTQSLFPLYIFLARPVSNFGNAEYSAVYGFDRACMLTNSSGANGMNQAQVNFILPEINKLAAEVKSGSLAVLFVICAEVTNSVCAIDPTKNHMDITYFPSTAYLVAARSGGGYLISTTMGVKISPLFLFPYCVYIGGVVWCGGGGGGGGVMEYSS